MTAVPRQLHELIADVRRARGDLLGTLAGFTDAQGAWKPGGGEWSIGETVEHLVLAEQAGLSRIWRAAEAADGSRTAAAVSPNRGLSIEEIVARTWKPREQAPPNATPQQGEGPLAYWAACLEACQPVLDALSGRLQGKDLEAIVFPHFLCGPLDARQRLEFLRFHLDRHRQQIQRRKSEFAPQRVG